MNYKRSLSVLCLILAFVFVFTACGTKTATESPQSPTSQSEQSKDAVSTQTAEPSAQPVKLVVSANAVGEWANVLQGIANKFVEENKNVTLDFQAPGKEYENIMKIKMSSNDMPDVFATHGWAKVRYGNFLADLKDEEWVPRISPAIRDSVSDSSGKVYILPMDWSKDGIVFNQELVDKYGITIPKTLDEWAAVCETIKTKSNGTVIPIHCGASDNWMMGQIFDYFGTSMAISPDQNYRQQFLDGTYDWNLFQPLPEKMLEFVKKGYFNKDVLTSKFTDSAKAMAEGKAVFVMHGAWMIDEAKKTNPDFKGGFMPVPSIVPGDLPTFSGGEKTTWGAWKDSKVLDTAKSFIAYFAKPENTKAVCENTKLPSGLSDVTVDVGELTPYFDKYKDIRVFDYWDRVYLPNGIWDPMCKFGQELFGGVITPAQFDDNMKKEFDRLYKAVKE